MDNRKVYIETYGCQMNKLDSETVGAILSDNGYRMTGDMGEADIILLNTCGVRENAEIRIHGRVAELSSMRRGKPELLFGIIGCMAKRLEKELLSDVVSLVAGPDAYRKLPDMIRTAFEMHVSEVEFDPGEMYQEIEPLREEPGSAWVAVMRGCDNFCSYCIVPYTRGRERSIPRGKVIEKLKILKSDGCLEVTLLGQNVNSYKDNGCGFSGLLEDCADTGIEWIRFLTSHPKDLEEHILDVMAERDNICPHLHLPVQSGSDRILKSMNRGYKVSDYIQKVEKARKKIKGLSITTDLIFGFPGETEEDFQATLELMKEIRFNFAFLYRYSEREGTKAASFKESVPEKVRLERLSTAIELQRSITAEKNREFAGTMHRVFVKSPSKDGRGWFGMTEINIPVVFTSHSADISRGTFVDVLIESTTGASLVGRMI